MHRSTTKNRQGSQTTFRKAKVIQWIVQGEIKALTLEEDLQERQPIQNHTYRSRTKPRRRKLLDLLQNKYRGKNGKNTQYNSERIMVTGFIINNLIVFLCTNDYFCSRFC